MREQYLQMRRTGQYDFGWFYQYYLENKSPDKDTVPFEGFVQAFRMYFQFNSQEIVNTLDKKFSVTKIEDSNNNILYIN
jgi:hypothetical protein